VTLMTENDKIVRAALEEQRRKDEDPREFERRMKIAQKIMDEHHVALAKLAQI
jgi:hypothetical protein